MRFLRRSHRKSDEQRRCTYFVQRCTSRRHLSGQPGKRWPQPLRQEGDAKDRNRPQSEGRCSFGAILGRQLIQRGLNGRVYFVHRF